MLRQIRGSNTEAKRKSCISRFQTAYIDVLKTFYEKGSTPERKYELFLNTKVVRDFFLEFVETISGTEPNYAEILTDFFETMYNQLTCIKTFEPNAGSASSDEMDVFKNLMWEMFICVVTFMRHIKDYSSINTMLTHTYFLGNSIFGGSIQQNNYTAFRYHSRVIEEYYKPHTEMKNKFTLMGDVICSQREKLPIYTKEALAEADLFLYQVCNAYELTESENSWRDPYWFPTLYVYASDIRGDYVDKLKRGKSNEEATQELIKVNQEIMGDIEEEPLFWFALADTQWNYGRLLPEVKEKALYFLSQDAELERWKDSGEKKMKAWVDTLEKLRQKLLSPLPEEKTVSKYRFYQCKWKLGDVFAYRFSSEYSMEKGLYGKYIVFRKVSEDTYWPGHVVPVIQVYKWIGEEIPSLGSLADMKLLVMNILPVTLLYEPNWQREYMIKVLSTSKRVIPEKNLTYLGNIQGEDLIPFQGHGIYMGYPGVGWDGTGYNRSFESHMIDHYLGWVEFEQDVDLL